VKNRDIIDGIILQLQALKTTPPASIDQADTDWQARAHKAEAQLEESRRQVQLLRGEIACLRDSMVRRLASK
jgi:hypothetical protein